MDFKYRLITSRHFLVSVFIFTQALLSLYNFEFFAPEMFDTYSLHRFDPYKPLAIQYLGLSSTILGYAFISIFVLTPDVEPNLMDKREIYFFDLIKQILMVCFILVSISVAYHYYSEITFGEISSSFLAGKKQPLFPGQLGILYLLSIILIMLYPYSRMQLKDKLIILFIGLINVLLTYKRIVIFFSIFEIFLISLLVSKQIKISKIIIVIFIFTIVFSVINSLRQNHYEISFLGQQISNYWQHSHANFISQTQDIYEIYMSGESKPENFNFSNVEKSAGNGFYGSLLLTSDSLLAYLAKSFFIGLIFFVLNYFVRSSNEKFWLLLPLTFFYFIFTISGDFIFHKLFFIFPIMLISLYLYFFLNDN